MMHMLIHPLSSHHYTDHKHHKPMKHPFISIIKGRINTIIINTYDLQ